MEVLCDSRALGEPLLESRADTTRDLGEAQAIGRPRGQQHQEHGRRAKGTGLIERRLDRKGTIVLLTGIALRHAIPARATDVLHTRSTTSAGQLRAQRTLVAVEVAFALALLVGSAITVQSYARVRRIELGFVPEHVTTLRLTLPAQPYPTFQASARLFDQLLQRVHALPSVTAAGAANTVPLTAVLPGYKKSVEPLASDLRAEPTTIGATLTLATSNYFSTMGMSIVRGRTFQSGDLRWTEHPVIVSKEAARQLFGHDDVVGQQLKVPDRPNLPSFRIVGVATDVLGDQLAQQRAAFLYFPLLDDHVESVSSPLDPTDVTVVVRSSLPSAAVGPQFAR